MDFPAAHVHIMVRRTIHHRHIQEKNKQVHRPPLFGRSWAERIHRTCTCRKSRIETGDTHGYDGSARAKMPVSFFCIANEFGKYDYEDLK